MKVTALRMVQAECANWRADGKGCLGAIIDDDLRIRRCRPKRACLLTTGGARCAYFEECVAPMASRVADAAARRAFEAAVREYRLAAGLLAAVHRPCPQCGRPMGARRRFCDVCAPARHRANQRAWARQQRGCDVES